MTSYLISYDLISQKDYTNLIKAIQKYPLWGKVLESTWIVVTDGSAKDVFSFLYQYIDSDDRLFVLKSGNEAHWVNIICTGDWLQRNL